MNKAISVSTTAPDLASGKGHKDENFPVASWLVRADARAPIMAYYRFARAADDIADHPTAPPHDKLARLAAMRAGLDGDGAAVAMDLAATARARGLDLIHAQELLDAFVQDVTVNRTADWAALIAYCRMSAMPVGRFVLDVHGEDRALWPLSDALCAALQIVNHLQDCGKDYRAIGRVYVPGDMLAAAGVTVEALGEAQASPALRGVIKDCANRTLALLHEAAPFAAAIRDLRLAAEVAVIQRLAVDLAQGLTRRDPLSENVHHSKLRAAWLAAGALPGLGMNRLGMNRLGMNRVGMDRARK
ncbi:MAG: squalene synthase HpnC [Pseudomonadota bacterium]|nr:squalene synthase HpnC [Pseudomonadota bacterium]